MSAKALSWESDHLIQVLVDDQSEIVQITYESKIHSLTSSQAVSALSSVSYQDFLTCASRLSLLALAVSLVSTPFCFKNSLICFVSQSLYGVATLDCQFVLTKLSRSLRSAGDGYGMLLSDSHRSSSVSCHLLYAVHSVVSSFSKIAKFICQKRFF